jgi:hypothetical protein
MLFHLIMQEIKVLIKLIQAISGVALAIKTNSDAYLRNKARVGGIPRSVSVLI